ncbi:response regulator transcription factor [Methylobacterium segetis]|uniref:response regulator transcription factor n=1 Tax=Methylobacterium segetis TaxID=2488750 RepID=UPI00104C6C6A|nr:response regulator transcription factor [Methylobacterium segetis]
MRPSILVIEDDPPIRKLLRMGLATQGYAILEAPDGRSALDLLARESVELVILDLGLPDMRGHDLLRAIRASHPGLPVVVLSSRDDEPGKVEALDHGADDYVTKPFGMAELLARLRAALRHQLAAQGERPVFGVDRLSVDLVRRIVRVDGAEVKLTPREYDFLRVLVLNAGKVMTHAQLMHAVSTSSDPQYLRVYMRQLRQKLEADPERPRILLTETGIGYRLRAPDDEPAHGPRASGEAAPPPAESGA